MQIHCIVKPQSKIDSVTVNPDNSLRIKIKAPPVNGKANEYLIEFLSEIFNLPKKNIQIVSGLTNSHKRINIAAEDSDIQKIISNLKKSK
ncbi:MAG: DUF167 domain-containing protein [Bacteroidetes bacterium]|nr:DUF167 domain-containing protein [Bacteroidota bacterium]